MPLVGMVDEGLPLSHAFNYLISQCLVFSRTSGAFPVCSNRSRIILCPFNGAVGPYDTFENPDLINTA